MSEGMSQGMANTIVGSLSQAGVSLGGAFLGQHFNRANMEKQNQYNKEMLNLTDQKQRQYTVDQYGLQKTGLQLAGYNPLAAFHNGGMPSSQEQVAASSPTSSSSGSNPLESLQIGNMIAQQGLLEAQTRKTDAETEDIEENSVVKSSLGKTQIRLNQLQEQNYDKIMDEVQARTGLTKRQAEKAVYEKKLTQQQTNLVKEEVSKLQGGELINKYFGTGPITADKVLKLGAIAGGWLARKLVNTGLNILTGSFAADKFKEVIKSASDNKEAVDSLLKLTNALKKD